MPSNPFRYKGPLDPVKEELICVPRENEVNRVIEGITRGDYWAILGPRQIGKTTFLRQIKRGYPAAVYIYFDFEVSPKDEGEFYDWVMEKFMDEIPSNFTQTEMEKLERYKQPSFKFFHFLERFKPEEEQKKIILFFDELEKIPAVKSFLRIWRKVFHDRFDNKRLNKYAVIITGSVDLFKLTIGPNSPFNIAEFLYLKDFTKSEADRLIENSFSDLHIRFDSQAKKALIDLTSGHPQLLQHACHILVQKTLKKNITITSAEVDESIKELFKLNSILDTLLQDLRLNDKLRGLVNDTLLGKKKKYFPHKLYSISGAGAIVESNSSCKIRNKIFEMILKDILLFPADEPGNRYEFQERCGTGSVGIVHKAMDSRLNRVVAIKILNTNLIEDEESRDRFLFEARLAAQLSHENIVTVYDVGTIEDYYYISMEFVDGVDLATILKAGRRFTLKQILYIMKELLKALNHSHNRGIIHRDIKPKNIMISREGIVKIVDFSIAMIRDNYKTGEAGVIFGTPYYISPEQIRTELVDQRADIYSFGATMYHIINEKVPFDGENKNDIFQKHLYDKAPPIKDFRKDIPQEVIKIIEKCMEKEPENRFQDTSEILECLKKVKRGWVEETLIKKEMKNMIPAEKDSETYLLEATQKVNNP